ncbi:MAG: hypothetical protein ACI9YT_000807, partial [Halobacteriales archaeon]
SSASIVTVHYSRVVPIKIGDPENRPAGVVFR